MISTSRSAASSRSARQNVPSLTSSPAAAWPCSFHTIPESRNRPGPPRNRWSETPSSFMALASSVIRCGPRPSSLSAARCASSGTSTSPSSPSVQVTRVTWVPRAAYDAIVAPCPIVSSSGCACTSINRWSMHAMLGVTEVSLDPTRRVRQRQWKRRPDVTTLLVEPAVVLLDQVLEQRRRRLAEQHPRVVLVVVLTGEPLAGHLGDEPKLLHAVGGR